MGEAEGHLLVCTGTHMSVYIIFVCIFIYKGLPRRLSGKESTCNAEDTGSISGLGRSHGEGNGNPLQYSSLENPMDRGAWRILVHGFCNDRVTKQQR